MEKSFNEIVQDLLLVYNQVELAEKTGVSQPIISDLKNGKVKERLWWSTGNALEKAHKANARQIKRIKDENANM